MRLTTTTVATLLAFMSIFEIVALARVHLLGHPLSAIVPTITSPASPQMVRIWSWMAAVLALTRGSQLFGMHDRSAWRSLALIHIAELAYFVIEMGSPGGKGDAVLAAFQTLVLRFDTTPMAAVTEPTVFLFGLIMNAVVFTVCWFRTPASGSRSGGGGRSKRD